MFPVGGVVYVLDDFPQLSETFIENEIRAVQRSGVDLIAFSLYHPQPQLAGTTQLTAERLHYRPGSVTLARHFLRWALKRPRATLLNVLAAVRLGSLTMLRGAMSAPWVASTVERSNVRHLHAHFALDAAGTAIASGRLLRLPVTITIHAHEIYLRNRNLSARLRMADRLVTVCQYNVGELLARCPDLDLRRLDIVYCGVDPDSFPYRRRGSAGTPFRLLSVGRLVEIKGFEDLIRAIALLHQRGHEIACEIVGHGELQAELAALIGELQLQDAVRLVGALPPAAVAQRMADADLFVLACKIDALGNRDSMPVVIKEAMASGLPVVSTAVVAVPEMVDQEVGRLAEPGDPRSLADAIEDVIGLADDERAELGRRGRARVEERFNVHKEAQKLLRCFDAAADR